MNRWRKESTPRERLAFYYDFLLTERVPAYEMRLFSLADHYRSAYRNLRDSLRTERLGLWKSKILIDLLVAFLGMGVAGGVMIWMGWRVITGAATLGDLAALYQIFTQVQSALGSITGRAGDIYESILFLEDLFVFLDLKPKLPDISTGHLPPLRQSITFENVAFRYPGSERDAISGFSTTLPAGKIVALVGENGEGKTTLMKLLCRFFDPVEGRVLWDGVDLRDVPITSLRRQITILFQNPYYYPESAHNNIAIGDIDKPLTREDVERAARVAAAHDMIDHLPNGYETILGKWFGGEDLSIGQWQRLALARAFVREASLIILDEPTSAMDAWAETDWLSNIREVARERTLIMITHRFTTAMHADLILVLHKQAIIEQGSHAELLARGGRYATSWYEQMREAQKTDSAATIK
jgi:ATP-binding cassette subfamily B protein